jgi:hypothetical protein
MRSFGNETSNFEIKRTALVTKGTHKTAEKYKVVCHQKSAPKGRITKPDIPYVMYVLRR